MNSELWNNLLSIVRFNSAEPMLFNSGLFLILFTGFMAVYGLLYNKNFGRILFVTLFSYYFYYKSSGNFFLILLLVFITDFYIGKQIYREEKTRRKKFLVGVTLAVDLGLLLYFKYTNLLAETFHNILNKPFDPFDIILPVGISFFIFQSISYVVDIYRGKITPLDSWFDYNFYLSFFPQLVAGPIVRARDFIPQIKQKPFVSQAMFGTGIFLIATGLIKKAVISDYISINFVDRIFDNPSLYSGLENLIGVYGYAIQIYCDFSGYSDMAIGLALLLGFKFNRNFDSPYKSANISEFWRRWHISLSSWLRDYLYIPLGESRKGKIRTYINLLATMSLGGLWHGASLRFLLWGTIHGVALVFHKFSRSLNISDNRVMNAIPSGIRRIFGIIITFHIVCLC